jgi:hypothetical protein
MPEVQLSDQALGELIAYLRILRPPRRGEIALAQVTLETTDLHKLSGIAVNHGFEDMQLRADGRVHLLRREGSRFREVTSQVDWSTYDRQLTANRFSALKQSRTTRNCHGRDAAALEALTASVKIVDSPGL